ncbi:vanadium-dependent haloperoxidase [Rubrolithibacter danxiaensis]|uniref:vanadium-dependent haloperoxidase n=1 Tax=Rubrolithibacter danxiaensis TaxID=3390805 RepID=UPI003BF7DA44
MIRKLPLLFLCFLMLNSACRKDDKIKDQTSSRMSADYDGSFIRSYYDLTCKIVKNTSGFFPTQASRAYAYISLAVYEAAVPGIDLNASLAGQINGLSNNSLPKPEAGLEYNWAIAANAATSDMMRKMFEIKISSENLNDIKALEMENKTNLANGVNTDVVIRSEAFGKAIAEALYEYSKTDGGHQSYLDPFKPQFTSPAGDDQWVPTGSAKYPVSPKWGENRPFLTSNITQTEPAPCYPFSFETNSDLYKDALEVYKQVKNNTEEQVLITKFWADDPFNTCTPTGHTVNILTQLLEENNASLAKTAIAYGKMGIAEHDAFIACWKCKYKTNRLRPVTYIQKYIDTSFTTVIGTPPFPTYVSGHSAEIGAGSEIFTDLFTNGDGKYKFTDRSQIQYGFEARSWNSFDEMAKECADSRFYGGIHFKQDNDLGLVQGKLIGKNINKMIKWPKGV